MTTASQETIARRSLLKQLSSASLAALGASAPRTWASDAHPVKHPESKADSCILIWLAGGMAAPDTFDPKRYLPFQKGLDTNRILSTFPAIDTAVDDIKFTEGLEHLAQVMDRGTIVRSAIQPDLGNILHSRHQYHWHTGYVPPLTVAAPHIGAWMAKVLGPQNPVIPPFINIGQRLEGIGEKEELKAFTTAGFFGTQFGPMNLPYPEDAVRSVQPPAGMEPGRFANRYRHYQRLIDQNPNRDWMSDFQQESMLRSMDNAHRLLQSKERNAFDLTREPLESRQAYDTGRFGRGCLLARRLVESGARFVEVTTEYVPFLHWDTHENGHATVSSMKQQVDRPIATLIRDLEQRGLLERTLVIIASEFSRDMMIEGVPGSTARDQSRAKTEVLQERKHYGLHRHFTGGSSVLFFGGGMKRGFAYGKTASERPLIAVEHPVSVENLHATLFTAMGISPKTAYDVEKRPFFATRDGHGKSVNDLFA
ncbi:MAG: DUF1501 domain-containing protein [Verrucomicrobiota bacterium]